MKAISLASCILLSILVILLLSTAAQATEYREVKAEDILKQIENGEDVNLTDCHIVGELNVSKIEFETVSNPYIRKLLMGKGLPIFPDEERTPFGPKTKNIGENLSIIESNIMITNSTFEKIFNFSHVLFKCSADFSRAYFNTNASFVMANFKDSADFSEANFRDSAAFMRTNFNNSADFSEANFRDSAAFMRTNFNNSADFRVPDTSEKYID